MPVAQPVQPMQVAQPVGQPAFNQAQLQMAAPPTTPFSNHPTALGNVAGLPSPMVLVRRPDRTGHFVRDDGQNAPTNDPHYEHRFIAPAMDLATTEAD